MKTIMASPSPSNAPTRGWRVHSVAKSSTYSGIKDKNAGLKKCFFWSPSGVCVQAFTFL